MGGRVAAQRHYVFESAVGFVSRYDSAAVLYASKVHSESSFEIFGWWFHKVQLTVNAVPCFYNTR